MPFKSKKCISGYEEIIAYDVYNETIRKKEFHKSKVTRDIDILLKKAELNKYKWIEGSRVEGNFSLFYSNGLKNCQTRFNENLSTAHHEKITGLKK